MGYRTLRLLLRSGRWSLTGGDKVTGPYNYFGIKAGNGDPNNSSPGTVAWTHENINGKKQRVLQKFRDYPDLQSAILDRAKFTDVNGRYRKAGYFDAQTPYAAAQALERANYAPGEPYADKIGGVLRGVGVDPYRQREQPQDMTMNYTPDNDPFRLFT